MRRRSTLPVSTGSDPVLIKRLSIMRPAMAPTARPITTEDRPRTEPPMDAPRPAPMADRTMVAICYPLSGKRNVPAMRRRHGAESELSTTP